MTKMVCDKAVCKRCVGKMVFDKVVWERWCVTKLCERCVCVCESWCVSKLCVKVVCERWCVTKLCEKDGVCKSCECQSATSIMPATQNDGGCCQVARLPRKAQVDVAKYHSATQKYRGVTGDQADPSAPPDPAQFRKCHTCHAKRQPCVRSATLATQNDRGCRQVPRLSRKSAAASWATKGTQARHQTHVSEVPRLPRKAAAMCVRSATCHAKRTWMLPSATPVTQKCRRLMGDQGDPSAPPDPCVRSATPATQSGSHVCQKCHVPRKTNVDVAKCHACHAKVPPSHGRPRGPKRATRPSCSHVSEVPCQPRKTAAMCQKCHACHAKRRWICQVPRLRGKSAAVSRANKRTQARHQTQSCVRSATPAAEKCQREGGEMCVKDSVCVCVTKMFVKDGV